MSQHPSLKPSKESGIFRSVLKRYEKVKELSEKDKWEEEKDSVYHLPKVKRIKFKVKKKTAEKAEEEGAVAEGAAPAAEGAAPAAEGAAPAAAPEGEKKAGGKGEARAEGKK